MTNNTIPCEELPETLECREEYMQFIETNKYYIETIADRSQSYLIRMLANFALSEKEK